MSNLSQYLHVTQTEGLALPMKELVTYINKDTKQFQEIDSGALKTKS